MIDFEELENKANASNVVEADFGRLECEVRNKYKQLPACDENFIEVEELEYI